MRVEHFYGHLTSEKHSRGGSDLRPGERRGIPTTGRIVKLFVGRACGFIRLSNEREVYFHRADLHPGTSFNDLALGEDVNFDCLHDTVSGARALRVRRNTV